MTSTLALPAVASRTYSDCKKCGIERFHIVVAHTGESSAKLECEVCHTKKTLKLKPAKAKSSKPKKVRVPSSAGRWEEVKGLVNESEKQSYSMKTTFPLHATVDHPKFGVGVVTAVAGHSMEVVFPDGARSLVHGRI